MNCWPSGKYVNLLYVYSILGRGSFCFNYCLNSAWHGGDQFVALMRLHGSPGAFQNMQAAHNICTYAPPYHQRCWLLNWMLITRWKVSLLFSPEDTAFPDFATRMSNLDSSDHRTLFHFETVHFKWALPHRTRRCFWAMFKYGIKEF